MHQDPPDPRIPQTCECCGQKLPSTHPLVLEAMAKIVIPCIQKHSGRHPLITEDLFSVPALRMKLSYDEFLLPKTRVLKALMESMGYTHCGSYMFQGREQDFYCKFALYSTIYPYGKTRAIKRLLESDL